MEIRNSATPRTAAKRSAYALVLALCLVASGLSQTARAQSGKDRVAGVTNFGKVTDLYFRGGKVTPEGIQNLYDMGVRTIVDLAGKGGEEEATCKQLGITWYTFPMNGSETPSDSKVREILGIIQSAKEPVYVHCSAGKHRAGTICAVYRTRVQGWTPEKAWDEQQSYGFGPSEGHPELYAYVYGGGADQLAANTGDEGDARTILKRGGPGAGSNDEESASAEKASKKSKKKDDDDEKHSGKKSKKKDDDDEKHSSKKSKKKDDDE
jgi:protein tyrosine phosphatase (PTP) superfamily phosphohydrolase (DUF442 family)